MSLPLQSAGGGWDGLDSAPGADRIGGRGLVRELDEEARKAPLDGPTIGGVLARNRLELLAG